MTWRELSISNDHHVIKRTLNPRFLNQMASHDVASIYASPHLGRRLGIPHQQIGVVTRG